MTETMKMKTLLGLAWHCFSGERVRVSPFASSGCKWLSPRVRVRGQDQGWGSRSGSGGRARLTLEGGEGREELLWLQRREGQGIERLRS